VFEVGWYSANTATFMPTLKDQRVSEVKAMACSQFRLTRWGEAADNDFPSWHTGRTFSHRARQ
jgi:hypothetical protein